MNHLKLFFALLVIVLSASSCVSSQLKTSDVKPVEVSDILLFEPVSYISLIEKGNNGIHNDSISREAEGLLIRSIDSYRGKLPLALHGVALRDPSTREKFEDEIDFLISSADRNKTIERIPLTPLIDSLLTVNDKRFGLIVLQSGFTRNKGNYAGQVAQNVGLGILAGVLTGTAYYQTPIKAYSSVYAIIVDKEKKNIAFYNKSAMQDKEPTDEENLTKQFSKIFEKYFWEK